LSGFEAERILIANPYGIGDILFTTPLVSTLRKAFPKSYIAFLIGSRTKEVLNANPEVDEIFVFDRDTFRAKPKLQAYKELLALVKVLRRKKFNLYVDLSNTSMYGFLSFIVGIKWRVGFNYKNRGRFLNYKMPLSGFEDKHVIEYYLSLLDFLPVKLEKVKTPKFYLSKEAESWTDNFLASHNLKRDIIVGIHPGGGASWGRMASFKWWGREKFIFLAKTLMKKYQTEILFFSEPNRDNSSGALEQFDEKLFIYPKDLTLPQFAALIKRVNLLICNEGGPLQIAVAVGTPTVSIYGPVSEIVYGPYPPAEIHQVVTKSLSCQPCYRKFSFKPCQNRRCLDELGEEEILDKARKIIGNKSKLKIKNTK